MQCTICGEEYGTFHDCRGRPSIVESAEAMTPGLRFAPIYYLEQAVAIARLDEAAIRRASTDDNAFLYGALFWFVGVVPALFTAMVVQEELFAGDALLTIVGIILVLPLALLGQILFWGLCHVVARFALRGHGRFVAIIRVMLLGSIVGVITVIPVIGTLIASLWGLAILMVVFEAIHGIRRFQAFVISYGLGILVRVLGLM